MPLHSLMFGWEYPPHHSGGLGVACQGLVKGLLQNGVKVTLVLPHPHGQNDGAHMVYPTEDTVSTILVPSLLQPYETAEQYKQRLNITSIPREGSTLYGADMGQAVESFAAMAVEMTKDVRPDVVHAHDWMTYEAGRRAARHHKVPFVAHIHATELDRTNFSPNQWIAERERLGLLAADRIIAVSQYTRNLIVQHYGIDPAKVSVVYNGHNLEHIGTSHQPLQIQHGSRKTPLVLFLGRLTIQKNPWQFLQVARRIANIMPETQFVMAGDGEMLTEMVDLACELGIADRVIFTGKVRGREIEKLYRNASCFVMPSLSEPFGLVALEAIAHGAPVVVTRQSGVAEVLDHAFKVDFWDTEKMADCIITILREEPLADQLKTEAPRILQKLTWKNQAGYVQSIYHDSIQS